MARRTWIAVLGFALFLFVLVDAFMLWYAVEVAISTWDVYRTLRKRIDSESKKRKIDQSLSVSKGSNTSWQPRP
jgi:hypothetical protein